MSMSVTDPVVIRPFERWSHAVARVGGESKTQQQFKDECDINVIVRRWVRTGIPPDYRQNPLYGDFSAVPDFQSAMNQIKAAEENFMKLPAEVRSRFNHDPGELLAWLDDPRNEDEAIELGMLPPKPAPPSTLNAGPEAPAPEAAASPPEESTP